MAFDGIVTKSVTKELQNITNFKIDSVYQPNKNTIILGLYARGEHLNLLSCINSTTCRIHLTTHLYKNPAVSPNFCMLLRKHIIGYKIKQIYVKDLERIVFIDLENTENPNKPIIKTLIIELMGKHSNIILVNENNIVIDSLRHTSIDEKSNRDIYPTARYIFPESNKYSFLDLKNFDDFYAKIEPKLTEYIVNQSNELSSLDISQYNVDKIISEAFNGISSLFINYIMQKLLIKNVSIEAFRKIYDEIKKIINANFHTIILNNKEFFMDILDVSSNKFNINFLIDDFYFNKETLELFNNYKNNIFNIVSSTLNKYKKRLLNIDNKLKECENKDKYKLYGELITSNLYKISSKNISSVVLENYNNNNEELEIPLNPQFSPVKNANLYFKKYTKLKNTIDVVTIQKNETIQDINYLESILYELDSCISIQNLDEIMEEVSESALFENKIKSKNKNSKISYKKNDIHFNPLKYIINGYTIFVGRNNKENDYLTCKFAKKNDLWFHTKDTPGSHVILKVTLNETIPNEILVEAAKLAAGHSKAKNSSHTPVDYCEIRNIKKPSGSKPGFVIYNNNKTIYV